ncbi:MAG: branched-chain amino acid ABC transporter permease [Chloroflexi bacterium]|nr:branched-chain amino acid ABC transporter permease [Chloroflexota bacterium]
MAEWELFGQSFHLVVQAIINGLLLGGLYALIALGIVVINKASGVFNFAHGWMMFAGGLIFWQFYANEPSTSLVGIMILVSTLLIGSAILGLGFLRKPAPLVEDSTTGASQNGDLFHRVLIFMKRRELDPRRTAVAIAIGAALWAVLVVGLLQDSSVIVRGAAGAFIGSILIGLMIERITIRPLLGKPLLTAILMTLAIGFVLQGFTQIIWGPNDRKIDVFTAEAATSPSTGSSSSSSSYVVQIYTEDQGQRAQQTKDTVGTGTAPDYRIKTEELLGKDLRLKRFLVWGFFIAIGTFVAFTLFFRYTTLGLAMRATAENQVLAESVGLRVRLMLAVAWAIVAVMAAIAGIIQGTGGTGVAVLVVPILALRVFPAVLLGGLESITWAMVGGLVIGVVEQLTIVYLDTTAAQQMAPFVVLIIVLLIRPDGLFGQRRIDRV